MNCVDSRDAAHEQQRLCVGQACRLDDAQETRTVPDEGYLSLICHSRHSLMRTCPKYVKLVVARRESDDEVASA